MTRTLTVGEIINGTLETLKENANVAIAFVAILSFIGLLFEWGLAQFGGIFADDLGLPETAAVLLGVGAGLGGLLFLVVAVIANYMLWEIMLQQASFVREGGRRFFRFIGQSILIGLVTALGFVLLIVPGLIVGARLAAAPAFLIGEKRGAIESMGESWEMVRGNTTPVVLTFVIGFILFIVLAMIVGGATFASAGQAGPIATFFGQVISNLGTVLTVALGVYLYRELRGPTEQLTEVFE